jgi:hypothetical protein
MAFDYATHAGLPFMDAQHEHLTRHFEEKMEIWNKFRYVTDTAAVPVG